MMSRAQPQQPRQTLSGPKATRTREGLVNAARDLFLKRGYVETSVDDIAEAAQVSRPTFYAYFHSKRDVMEAVGLTAAKAATPVFDALGELGPTWTTEDIAQWVRSYFAYQRVHGPWAIVFRQAITFDPQLKVAARSTRQRSARRIGRHLRHLGASEETDPLYAGLIVLALLETLWAEGSRSAGSESLVVDAASRAIEALIRHG